MNVKMSEGTFCRVEVQLYMWVKAEQISSKTGFVCWQGTLVVLPRRFRFFLSMTLLYQYASISFCLAALKHVAAKDNELVTYATRKGRRFSQPTLPFCCR